VIGEAEVGDPVGGRVRELLAAAHGGWRGGSAHGGRWSRRRRRMDWARALGDGGGGIRKSNAQRARRTRGRSLGEGSGRFKEKLGGLWIRILNYGVEQSGAERQREQRREMTLSQKRPEEEECTACSPFCRRGPCGGRGGNY
jgi:hypothetical protein